MARDPATQPDLNALIPVAPRDVLGTPPPLLHYPTDNATYLRSPLPQTQWMQPDALRQFYRLGNPQNRIAPLPANALPAIITTATGISTNVVNNAIENIVFPPSTTGVTDGLVHGDPVWWNDPGFVFLREEFPCYSTSSGGRTIIYGNLGWNDIGLSAVVPGPRRFGPPLMNGWELNINTASTNTSGAIVNATYGNGVGGGGTDGWALLDHPGWKSTFVFSTIQAGGNYSAGNDFTTNFIPHTRMYVGLQGSNRDGGGNEFRARPWTFIGVRYDTDTTAPSIGDTTFHLEAVSNVIVHTGVPSNVQGVVFNTGIVPQQDKFYRLDIECTAVGTVQMTFSGEGFTTGPQTFAVPLYVNTPTAIMGTLNFTTFGNAFMTINSGGWLQGPGTKFTIASMTGGAASYNGNYVTEFNDGLTLTTFDPVGGGATSFTAFAFNVQFYPCYFPFFQLGTDASIGGALNKSILANYWSLVWNRGIDNASATPDATQARYWA